MPSSELRISDAIETDISYLSVTAVAVTVTVSSKHPSLLYADNTLSRLMTINGNVVPCFASIGYIRSYGTNAISVLGNQSKNDGTWRLRFFEMGVTRKNRGSIAPNWFLKNALSQQEAATQQVILAVEKTIDDINNEQ